VRFGEEEQGSGSAWEHPCMRAGAACTLGEGGNGLEARAGLAESGAACAGRVG
jgi:hypothetical protein